ncbi:hypothetical protein KJ564_00080, partial [bacterium]|nr:hypothetical protein [bacterium]
LAITFVYYGFARHRSPLNPIMMAFGGFALASYAEIFKDLRLKNLMQNRRALIASAIFLFFVIGWILEIFIDIGSLFNLGFTHDVWKDYGIGG